VFFKHYSLPFSVGERVSLGSINFLSNDVRKRSFDQLAWEDASNKEILYNNDRIFTDTNSKASIKFNSGNQLSIGEETLFQLSVEGESINLDLAQGIVFANLSSAAQSFVVVVDNKVFEINSKKANVKIDKRNGTVDVLKGIANVKVGKKTVVVKQGESASLTADLSIAPTIEEKVELPLVAPRKFRPSHREEFFFYSPSTIKLEWENIEDLNPKVSRVIKVNNKEYKTKKNRRYLNINQSQTIRWNVGYNYKNNYVWGDKEFIFDIVFDDESLPLKNGKKIVLKRPGDAVTFSWSDTKVESEKYLLEVSSDRRFDKIEKTEEVEATNVNLKFSKLGTFYWRTRIISPSGEVKYAPPVRIKVVPPAPPEPPKLRKKMIKKITDIFLKVLDFLIPTAQAQEVITLDWEKVENVKSYKIEIYDGDNLLVTENVTSNFYRWPIDRVGVYLWRVASVDYWNQVGEFSEYSEVVVEKRVPKRKKEYLKQIAPYHGRRFSYGQKITFKWSRLNSRDYIIEFSKDATFNKSKKINVKIEEFKLRGSKFQTFYWRVRSGDLVTKKRRVEIERKPTITVKSIPQQYSLYGIEYRPQSYSYENNENGKTIEISGADLVSFSFFYERTLSDYIFHSGFSKSSGKVFSDLDYSTNDLTLELRRRIGFNTYGFGVGVWYGSVYSVANNLVTEERSLKPSLIASGLLDLDYFHIFSKLTVLGVNSIEFQLQKMMSILDHDFKASLGFNFSQYSGEVNSQALFIGFSKSFKKY